VRIKPVPKSFLGKLIYRPHYLCVALPDSMRKSEEEIPVVEDFLGLVDDAKARLVIPERIKKFGKTAADKGISGFYAALASSLMTKYWELGAHPVVFSRAYYGQICVHLFCPPDRIHEQTVGDFFVREPIAYTSTLTTIGYNIRACVRYSNSGIAGRAKYLAFCSQPVVAEVFKGLEHLARLYSITLESSRAGKRFKALIADAAGLAGTEAEALWKFRCSILHSGSLYAVDDRDGTIWRFGYGWVLGKDVVTEDTASCATYLEGRHFSISLWPLVQLFDRCVAFVYQDMLHRWERYALHPNFPAWVQRYLCQQYLPSAKEWQPIVKGGAFREATDAMLKHRTHFGMAKVYVSWWYLWRLSFPRWAADVVSRVRSCMR
jgi:hypothetical protein